jgi:hypothetical protein
MRPPVTQWAYDNVFVRMVVVAIAFMTGVGVLGAMAAAEAQTEPMPPRIVVAWPTSIIGQGDWIDGATVTVEVDDPADVRDQTLTAVVGPTPEGDSWRIDDDALGLEPGFTITASDGATTRSLVVRSITFDGADTEAETVSGSANLEPGDWVEVAMFSDVCRRREVPVVDGSFTADFSVPGGDLPDETAICDLDEGSYGSVEQYDSDGDITFVWWELSPPGPSGPFNQFHEGDLIVSDTFGRLWAHNVDTGDLIQYDLPFTGNYDIQYLDSSTLLIAHRDASAIETLDLATGDIATFQDDRLDGVIGIAVDPAGDRIYLADENDGVWALELGDGTLTSLAGGSADGIVLGPDGWLYYTQDGQRIEKLDPAAADPSVTIDEVVDLSGYHPNGMVFDSDQSLVVASMGWGHSAQAAAVLRVDPASGGFSPLYEGDDMRSPEDVAIATDGTIYISDTGWVTEFGDDPGLYSLDPGTGTLTELYRGEPLGDLVDLLIAQEPPHDVGPTPMIVATWGGTVPGAPQNEIVQGFDWPEGEEVTVTVDDGSTSQSWTINVGERAHPDPPWWFEARDDLGTNFELHLEGVFDLAPGQTVIATSPSAQKSVEIVPVSIDDIDLVNDTVTGSAPVGTDVQVTIHQPWQDSVARRWTGGVSPWTVDFGEESDDGWGTADLVPRTVVSTDVWDDDGDASAINGYVPQPTFTVQAPFDIWSSNDDWGLWADGTPVHIVVDGDDDPDNGIKFDVDTAIESWGEAPWETGFGIHTEPDEIIPGDVVTVTVGDTTKVLHVVDIAIEGVDEDGDVVSGYAPPGSRVEVNVGNEEGGANRSVDADPVSGSWEADFSRPGDEDHEQDTWDLQPGVGASAQVFDDDDDSTQAGWGVEEPRLPTFSVRMESNEVFGYDWPWDTAVTLTVDDPATPQQVDYTEVAFPGPAEWDPSQSLAVFSPQQAGFQIQPGFHVEMTDGDTVKTHTVTDIAVAEIDPTEDTVSGHALPNVDVHVSVADCGERSIRSDADGWWLADFAAPGEEEWEQSVCDIVPGTQGDAQELDEDGDETHIVWRLPGLPEFGVSATHDWIEGYDFTGGMITFSFDDNENPADGVLYERTIEVEPGGSWLHVIDDFDVEIGQFVTVTDGVTVKTTTVAPLTIMGVDADAGTYAGTTDPGAEIDLFGFGPAFGFGEYMMTVGGEGTWSVDIADIIGEPAAVEPGTVLGAGQRDDDGDRTIVFWDPAVVEGHVYSEGQPVAGAEVFFEATAGAQHTCTDADGYFSFEGSIIYTLVRGGIAATGRAVSLQAACANAGFVDNEGRPLVTGFDFGPFDLQDGYENVEFDVVPAEATQQVIVEEWDGSGWMPADGIMVKYYDRNDLDFVAAFGHDPGPSLYPVIFESDLGQIGMDFTGSYLSEEPGSVELRYPHTTDVLILVQYGDEPILGDLTDHTEFLDEGGPALIGPVIVFPNQAPVITDVVGPGDPLQIGTAATITATFTDRNVHDSHTALIDWGDGAITDAIVDHDGMTATGDHGYATPGVYVVTVTVTDSGDLSDTAAYQYVVVYDPDGGFVTGGGWIDSPPGAYVPDPTLTGLATFGFVSKYKKGAHVPTGTTEFQFHAGDLNFHSDDYQWLVVAGAKAMFKGTGTVNGEDGYSFLISATDAALTPSTDVDLFRIKIWSTATGEIIYDNQLGDADDADPATAIGGGAIVVHDGKKAK